MTRAPSERRKVHPAWLILIAWLAFLAIMLAATGPGLRRPVRYVKVHDGSYWTWYTPEDVWSKYGEQISKFFDYADRVYEKLREDLGVEPKERVYLLVHPGGAGFARA